jgi:hypothetical protein
VDNTEGPGRIVMDEGEQSNTAPRSPEDKRLREQLRADASPRGVEGWTIRRRRGGRWLAGRRRERRRRRGAGVIERIDRTRTFSLHGGRTCHGATTGQVESGLSQGW